MEPVRCVGCGAQFPASEGKTHPYMVSSAGCWSTFCALLAREYADPALFAVHPLSVAAYALQHPGERPSRPAIVSVGLSLARLFLLLERGLPPARASFALTQLAEHKSRIQWLEPPASLGAVTVAEVASSAEPAELEAAVRAWARSVLDAWRVHHSVIETWLAYGYVPPDFAHEQ